MTKLNKGIEDFRKQEGIITPVRRDAPIVISSES